MKENVNIIIVLKVFERLCKQDLISQNEFKDILYGYKNMIDLSEFSCYNEDSKKRNMIIA